MDHHQLAYNTSGNCNSQKQQTVNRVGHTETRPNHLLVQLVFVYVIIDSPVRQSHTLVVVALTIIIVLPTQTVSGRTTQTHTHTHTHKHTHTHTGYSRTQTQQQGGMMYVQQ
eukprot:GHVQ01019581.1.p2 GENE.GHVQ01019581.1~~GHVQ01019581.1.p2  ORF type:complete len:112 (-),score=30.63 GHVQ01019581.1:495-830(-)